MPKYIVCILFIVCSAVAQAQYEHIEYLPQTPKKLLLKSTLDFSPTRLLTLPFFDDFAYPQTTPTTQLWADDFAFVNTSFAYNPPTIGVLTLDALDRTGNLYPQASSNVFTADYATSQPINLFDYRKMFASDKLYIKTGTTFELLEKGTYYLYEHSLHDFVDMVQGIPYYAGDTIYTKTATGFAPSQLSVYDENKNLIPESLDNSRIWIPYSINDSIVLSFYCQAGGNADSPEAQDSLVLEYYTPFARQGVFINEITHQWIEVFNATDTVVSLAGYYLIADTLEGIPEQEMTQWHIPAIAAIAPYSHAIVSAGDFGISDFTSNRYYLLSSTRTVVDSAFLESTVSAEISYARLPDGNPEWSFSVIETPAQPNDTWHTLWNIGGGGQQNEEFTFHQIPLNAAKYLQKGFRFRFKNYASLSNDVSHARNEDFWHIDMVWIDANREKNKPNIADVAFSTPITPLFNRYTALPKAHFSQLTEDDFRMTAESSFRNFDAISRKIKFHFAVHNSHNNNSVSFPSFETDLNPYQIVSERDILTDHDVEFFDYLTDESATVDSIDFEFQYFFTDNNNPLFDQYRWNDTSRVKLTLANYYAYDDGTPEAGYGLRNA
ncbi:MAG: lamin tail domain-containing protein, partial [Bacteroidales bacterium]|nr:lamin tail domain-containing protein [Bacteroidales bacterium]